jgi:hypothetical protein
MYSSNEEVSVYLHEELQKLAPDWDWNCKTQPRGRVDLISPDQVKVTGIHRGNRTRTLPIYVSGDSADQACQTAQFILQVLMLHRYQARVLQPALTVAA